MVVSMTIIMKIRMIIIIVIIMTLKDGLIAYDKVLCQQTK